MSFNFLLDLNDFLNPLLYSFELTVPNLQLVELSNCFCVAVAVFFRPLPHRGHAGLLVVSVSVAKQSLA